MRHYSGLVLAGAIIMGGIAGGLLSLSLPQEVRLAIVSPINAVILSEARAVEIDGTLTKIEPSRGLLTIKESGTSESMTFAFDRRTEFIHAQSVEKEGAIAGLTLSGTSFDTFTKQPQNTTVRVHTGSGQNNGYAWKITFGEFSL